MLVHERNKINVWFTPIIHTFMSNESYCRTCYTIEPGVYIGPRLNITYCTCFPVYNMKLFILKQTYQDKDHTMLKKKGTMHTDK